MNQKWYVVFLLSCSLLILLTACSDNNDEEIEVTEEETSQTDEEQNTNSDGEDEEQDSETESEDENSEEDSDKASQAVAPSEIEDTIEFTRIWFAVGSPDRQPNAGVWLYTEEDHPSNVTDVFDFEENDILLYQIGNEEYLGYHFRAQRIVEEDDNIVRVVLKVHDEPDEDEDPDDLEMPRQYLEVEKDALDGKSFIFETEDGESLSVQ